MNPAPTPEPLSERVAGLLERVCNPILVKELRGSLRGARFFVSYVVVLALVAGSLLLTFAASLAQTRYGNPLDPSAVGRGVFMVLQFLQLGVVFLVVPGLAATSLTTERESLTHELLVTTTLSARQIVWGKFSAAMAQTVTVLVSMLPLIGLCFLFGGVTVQQILAHSVFLVALSALVVAFALFVSAQAASTQVAVGSVYALAFLGGILALVSLGAMLRDRDAAVVLEAYGFVTEPRGPRVPLTLEETVLYVYVLPLFAWTSLFALFFISAVNRLKPLFANRSTNLRVYAVAVGLGAVALARWVWGTAFASGASTSDRAAALMGILTAFCGLVLLLSLFACEDPVVPAHLRARTRAGGLLGPGAGSGAAFTVALTALLAVLVAVLFGGFTDGFNRGAWAAAPAWAPFAAGLLAVVCWALFCAAYGRFLSTAMPQRPVLVRVLHVLGALALAFAPLLHWAVATEIEGRGDPHGLTGPWTLHLSAVAAVLSSLDLGKSRDIPFLALGIPIPAGFAVVALLLSGALHLLARRGPRS